MNRKQSEETCYLPIIRMPAMADWLAKLNSEEQVDNFVDNWGCRAALLYAVPNFPFYHFIIIILAFLLNFEIYFIHFFTI